MMRTVLLFVLIGLYGIGCRVEHVPTVALQPFEGFERPLADSIADAIHQTYGLEVTILPAKPLPTETFIHIRAPRHSADQLIQKLRDEKPAGADYILGLTGADLSYVKRDENGNVPHPESRYSDWGVFGLGFRSGVSAVMSTHRLRHANDIVFAQRARKIALHELGHNLGLPHCESNAEHCVMQYTTHGIRTVDAMNATLCPQCRERLVTR